MKHVKSILICALLLTLLTAACVLAEGAWQAGDPAIASVSPDGTITGVAPGETTVTVTVDGLSVTIPVTVFEACPHCGGPLDEGNHSERKSESSYCDVQHYCCTGTSHYCDPNGENPGCGDTYPCRSSNAHTPCRACGNLWCSRSASVYGHTAPCGNDSHRPCVMIGYQPGDHAICGDCRQPLCNGDRHGTGRGRCSYFEPIAQPMQPPVIEEPEAPKESETEESKQPDADNTSSVVPEVTPDDTSSGDPYITDGSGNG